jgi:hypothetical protein
MGQTLQAGETHIYFHGAMIFDAAWKSLTSNQRLVSDSAWSPCRPARPTSIQLKFPRRNDLRRSVKVPGEQPAPAARYPIQRGVRM